MEDMLLLAVELFYALLLSAIPGDGRDGWSTCSVVVLCSMLCKGFHDGQLYFRELSNCKHEGRKGEIE